jgi:hypothetical protein
MSTDMMQVLRILTYRGVDVWLEAGHLRARARQGLMPADMIRFIRHFRDRIVAELHERERLKETATSILTLTPEEQEQYERELRAAAPNDPHMVHDHRAYRLAMAWTAERSDVA